MRVYTVDNSADHDACMNALADAGIYLALDVNTPAYSLNRADNASIALSYNDVYLQFIFSTIDAFAKYDNTLLFFSGNEVINDNATSFAAPYVKAVTRDMKAYINARAQHLVAIMDYNVTQNLRVFGHSKLIKEVEAALEKILPD